MTEELFATDAYRRSFDAAITEVDREGRRVALARTAFYPGGGGQPHDLGALDWGAGAVPVTRVKREAGRIWHWVDAPELPGEGTEVAGELDWSRRHLLMRTHTALHVLCGVVWSEFAIPVTGGNMEPGSGRLDFPLPSISAELGKRLETRINDELAAANLIPREIDPLRVIDIVGLDKQADGGTHVASTAEVGAVRVTGTESKGKGNKRVRIEVVDAPA